MWDDLKYYLQALGINMLWNGYAIVIFVRDGLKIGPQGSIMMALFWLLGLFLLFPINIFQRIYSLNKTLLFFWGSFAAISVAYMIYYPSVGYNFRSDLVREITTYCFPLAFLFGMLYYPDNKYEILLKVTAIFALLGSLGLAYVLMRDPTWNIGQRAAIRFSSFHAGHEGNPHTFANNAVRCVLASAICMYKVKQIWQKAVFLGSMLFSIAIVLMTRTNTSLLTLGIAFGVFALFHKRKLISITFSYYTLSLAVLLFGGTVYASSRFAAVTNLLQNTWNILYKRVINTIYTTSNIDVGGNDIQTAATIDYSSIGRIISYKYFKEDFLESSQKYVVLLGEGYKSVFLDIPIIEAFVNQGILGFLLFGGFSLAWSFFSLGEIFQPTNEWNTFLAYLSFLFLIGLVTGGRPIDAGNWMIYMVYIRFLGASQYKTGLRKS
ncbi:hypothetical protein [Runella slithyformis]|uniref:O-antigen ligase domain-containing protein n=1 Tax=Runella slithyformis (strain ATCC 29530 / DSM 19594 / LMG 11500 / NCIMB 11436 / LSU 4) TaxID=761193 RepID=A0A7U4E508_RUNSL|nr:hypothetical protein [Runella slithyformis]AEI47988.1 hypothetical protein Runsl_1563 [Runella slithyformis DSM 19594]